MTYEAFVTELARLRSVADAAYSPSHFPGSEPWYAYQRALKAGDQFRRDHVKHSCLFTVESAERRAAARAAPGSLMDRIERGVD